LGGLFAFSRIATQSPREMTFARALTHVDLPALFDGKDPFAPSEPKENIASSKPNDFKDFGEK
jgi:hypothetical protein